MMRKALVLFVLAAAGCATHSANERPEPNVVELWSMPTHASVSLDCGAGKVEQGTTPVRVDLPRYPEVCSIEASADGYRTLRMPFNRGLVLKEGQPMREDEHHQLDQSAGTLDMLLFPLRNLADRVQNATMHKLKADYRFDIKLVPLPR
jgi:hypothetical protein